MRGAFFATKQSLRYDLRWTTLGIASQKSLAMTEWAERLQFCFDNLRKKSRMPPMNKPTDSFTALWLALLLFSVYLLSFSGILYSQDGMSMFCVTESWVKRGELNTNQLWTLFKARNEIAPDGESYAKYGYGTSLFAVPLYALALYLPFDLGLIQTTLLTSAMIIALAGAHVFLSARQLGFARDTSIVTALLFGLATPAWVYAKQFWSEPYALACLFAAFYFLQRFRAHHRTRDALLAAIALGLGVATRVTNAALVPLFAWYGFGDRWNDVRARRGLGGCALILSLIALSIAWYNAVRYGHPLVTGYRADETFSTPLLLGVYGLLFSPGKGLFLYVPFLATLAFAAPAFFQSARREAIFISAFFAFYLVLFALWYYWWSGPNWGPRFLVPTLPFLVLMMAPAIELARTQRVFALILISLCGLAVAIQLLGISIPALAYYQRLVRFSPTPIEDYVFSPLASPLLGLIQLLKPGVLDFAWIRVHMNQVVIDWLTVVSVIVLIVFSGMMLYRTQRAVSHSQFALAAVLIFAVAISLFSMYRYRYDARLGGSEGYRALVHTLAREEQAGDVLILNDDTRVPFFLNENRARVRWYGLSRDPRQFDEATRALLARLAQQYARVWFVYDDATAALPDPTREWLEATLTPITTYTFDDGVHLTLYQGTTQR